MVKMMTKMVGVLTRVLGYLTKVALGLFEDGAKENSFLIISYNVSCVARLATRFRSATIVLMRLLKVFLVRQCRYIVINFKTRQVCRVGTLIVVLVKPLCLILSPKLMLSPPKGTLLLVP